MYGREELKVYYADLEGQLYISKPFPGHDDTDTFIRKYEADSVMESYEKRIKELESQLENVQASTYAENVDANMALIKANERIKELEAEVKKWRQDNRYLSAFIHLLHKGEDANSTAIIDVANRIDKLEEENKRLRQANFDCNAHFDTLKEDYARLKAMKWISVDDIKPQWGKEVKVKFKDGSEDEVRFSYDYKWVSKGMGTCESSEVTHWMPLPATEKSSATEKGK